MNIQFENCLTQARHLRKFTLFAHLVICAGLISWVANYTLQTVHSAAIKTPVKMAEPPPSRFTNLIEKTETESKAWSALTEWLVAESPTSGYCRLQLNTTNRADYSVSCHGLASEQRLNVIPPKQHNEKLLFAKPEVKPPVSKVQPVDPISQEIVRPYGEFMLGSKPFIFDENINGWKTQQ